MSNGAVVGGVGGGAAAYYVIANAIKASGAIVRVESSVFESLVNEQPEPLVVYCEGRLFSPKYQYLTAYKGLVFYSRSATPLILPTEVEVIKAKKIWIPG